MDYWVCPHCGMKNYLHDQSCRNCNTANPALQYSANQTAQSAYAAQPRGQAPAQYAYTPPSAPPTHNMQPAQGPQTLSPALPPQTANASQYAGAALPTPHPPPAMPTDNARPAQYGQAAAAPPYLAPHATGVPVMDAEPSSPAAKRISGFVVFIMIIGCIAALITLVAVTATVANLLSDYAAVGFIAGLVCAGGILLTTWISTFLLSGFAELIQSAYATKHYVKNNSAAGRQ